MIEDIVRLKSQGYTVKQIARELNVTIGKVQYRWNRFRIKEKEKKEVVEMNKTNKRRRQLRQEFEQWKIPSSYQSDELVLMPQFPTVIHAYWDLSSEKCQTIEHHFRTTWSELKKVLRVYDITAIHFNGHNAHRVLEIELPEMTNNWFLRDVESNRTFCVDLGIKTFEGQFFSVLRSNPVDTPRVSEQQAGLQREAVHRWKEGSLTEPEWLEQFSTYSYYRR